jgi:hypothetical protein
MCNAPGDLGLLAYGKERQTSNYKGRPTFLRFKELLLKFKDDLFSTSINVPINFRNVLDFL